MPDNEVAALVAECVGWPYIDHGRDGANGVDCYGLLMWFAARRGFHLPDYDYAPDWFETGGDLYAREHPKHARPVDLADALPGDILFFTGRRGIVTHAGVYVGAGRFVHAARGLGVVVARLSQTAWGRKLDSQYRLTEPL